MATAREHFALDWIKADLLETLNDARIALDDYAEQGNEQIRMRACLTGLHQVHGTLVMLELKGVSALADHLEQLAQRMLADSVADEAAAGQALMQGILELPGYLDELQRGADDNVSTSMPLVNEIRALLNLEALIDPAGASLREGASDQVIARFNAIGGPEKVVRIRSAYQNVLLSILKGEDRSAAVGTLGKIALGLERVTEGAPLARQWQAFAEFVESLKQHSGALESEAVKLLRRVDLEIKNLAKDGESVLRQPVNMELIQQLLDGAVERDNRSEAVTGLQEALSRDVSNNTLAISGRQALGSAAGALQEELGHVKDKLDLLVRTESVDLDALRQLMTPLKQIGSTLSLLGFESSREIIVDQIEAIESLVVLGDDDPQAVQSIAGALVQIDENLSGIVLGSGQTEVEQITGDAQLQVLREARKDLDVIKQSIVDFVTAHWSIGHLQAVPGQLNSIASTLEIIPLPKAIELLSRVADYVESRLMQGHRPEWQELDQFADVISALDYYLERLADETSSGAEEILLVAQRSLTDIEMASAAFVPQPVVQEEAVTSEAPVIDETLELELEVETEAGLQDEAELAFAPEADSVAAIDADMDAIVGDISETAEQPAAQSEDLVEFVADEAVDIGAPEEALFETADDAKLDLENLPELEEPQLELEQEPGFDLSSDVFAGLQGTVERPVDEPPAEESASASAIELPDPEIVEIFIEEVDEVFETIGEYLPLWANDFDNRDALAEVRRGFHTLKGSGRIVQAVAIGELAWGVENMLNRVVDDTVKPNSQFVSVINTALALIPSLRDAFEQGQPGNLDAINNIIEQADLLSSGGTIETVAPAIVEKPVAETLEIDQPQVEALSEDAPAESASTEIEPTDTVDSEDSWLEENFIEASFADEQSSEIADTTEVDEPAALETMAFTLPETDLVPEPVEHDSTLELFVAEAREYLQNLIHENERKPWSLTDPIGRAFHTLTGGAALAELPQVQLIVEPAYQVVEAFRGAPATPELEEFFQAAQHHLSACLDALDTGAPWEEPFEFVAAADDLLATQGNAPRAVDLLLDAPATAVVFDSEEAVLTYLTAADRGDPVEPIGHLPETLTQLARLATEMRTQSLAQLATQLSDCFTQAALLARLPAGNATVMRAGYHQLIDQLNEIAAGSEPAQQMELVASIAALNWIEPVDAPVEVAMSAADAAEMADVAEVDADLVAVFFEEADEICEALETSILSWSTERDNRLFMENMLRGLHTLKGGARLCGLSSLGDMAHDYESVVIEVQNDERPIDDALFAELNKRYDGITARLHQVSGGLDQEPQVGAVAQPIVSSSVTEEATVSRRTPAIESLVDLTPDKTVEVSDVNKVLEAVNLQQAAAAAESAELPTETAPLSLSKSTASADAKPAERGGQEMVRVGSALLEELVNLAGESSILRARIEQGMSDFTGALDEMETTIERLREQLRRLEIETETQILHRHERNDGPQYENFDPLEMDRYNQLQQLSRSLSESASDMLDLKETLLFKARESETLLLQQARINTELQEGLMRTRMVPFNRLLPRLRRIVRQVSGELDKEVEFHVQNAEGELDRNLLERMVPPLEHMLRNAVDHGIENVDLRRSYGKSAIGRIDLRLTREGGDVVIEISDDGAGIDVETVREKAIERGLMAADARLNDEEILQFVLAAGFSTAKSVTQISGRGVGLDVVASEVKQLGGSISIVSRPGKGTRFVLRVPFTVSVNRALMVSVSEDLYAIPLNTIEGIVLLSPDQLQALYSSDSKTFEYAGVPYRVRYLGQYLGREYRGPSGTQTSVPVVLVRSGDHAVAIHVDLVQGSREIVVKSLGPQFAGVGGISGATILGDGSVVVILDLLALIRAQQFEGSQRGSSQRVRSGPRCVMVVDDSVTVRKVTSRILERQGMDVLLAKDGVEAVALLQERRPDVMLLDIEMPRMDGFEVARQVRHDDRLSDLPIVMISSRTGDKHKEHANQLGVNKFLGKPFQENELLATIDELVSPN